METAVKSREEPAWATFERQYAVSSISGTVKSRVYRGPNCTHPGAHQEQDRD